MKQTENTPWKKIHKALKDSLDAKEQLELERWLSKSQANRELFRNVRMAWNVSAGEQGLFQPDEHAAWKRIVRDAKIGEAANRSDGHARVRKMMVMLRNVAAILFLPLVIGTALLLLRSPDPTHPAIVSVATESGQRSHFTLDDGTRIWLNSNSQLTYVPEKGMQETSLALQGEAYFSVPPDRKLPVSVSTSHMDIRVTGTSFNVRAYENEDAIETVLESGSVELDLKSETVDEGRKVALHPDQRAVFGKKDQSLTIINGNTYEFTAWKDGVLAFRHVSFEDLAKRLEKWFDVVIEYEPGRFNDQKYSGIFRNRENLDQVLQSIQEVTPFDYQIENNRIKIH